MRSDILGHVEGRVSKVNGDVGLGGDGVRHFSFLSAFWQLR